MRKKLLAIFSAILVACSLCVVGTSVSALDDSKEAFEIKSVSNNVDTGTLSTYGKMLIVNLDPVSTGGYWAEIPGAADYIEIVNKDGESVDVTTVQTCGTCFVVNRVPAEDVETVPYTINVGDTVTFKKGLSFGTYELKEDVAYKYAKAGSWALLPSKFEDVEVTNAFLYNDTTGGWGTPAVEVELQVPTGVGFAQYQNFFSTVEMEYEKVSGGTGVLGTFLYTNTAATGARFLVRLSNPDTSNAYSAVNGDKITIKAGSYVTSGGVGYKVAKDATFMIVNDTATTAGGAANSCTPYVQKTVTFNPAGGVLTGEATQLLYPDEKINVPDPTREPDAEYTYTFNGWKCNGTLIDVDTFVVPGDVMLMADWIATKNTYTVTFDANGGVLSGAETVTLEYGERINVVAPTKEGTAEITYTFKGWKVDGQLIVLSTYTVTGNVTLVAEWTASPRLYTVTFDVNGGNTIPAKQVEYNALIDVDAPTKNATAEHNYNFNGWKLDGEFVDLATYTVTGDVTLVADWAAETRVYTVTFDTNGGSAVDAQQVAYGQVATLPEEPTKEGYNFVGWACGNDAYDFAAVVTGDVTITAVWQIKVYMVTFDVDGGEFEGQTTVFVKYGEFAVVPTAPTKAGYTFAGWTLNGESYDFETIVNEDITLVASWEEIPAPAPEEKGCGSALVGTLIPSMIALVAAGVVVTSKKKRG